MNAACRGGVVVSLVLVVASSAWSADLLYQSRSSAKQASVAVAKTDGRSFITMMDMHNSLTIFYYNMAREVHQRQLQWLHGYIQEQLLAARAHQRGVTVADLLKAEVKPAPVTDAIVAQFLAGRDRPNDKLTAQEREFLEHERWLVARREYLERLWQESKITIDLPEPEKPQVIVSEANTSPVLGLQDAPANIIEFCAFTSPHCRDIWMSLRQLVKQYGHGVRIVHRDYPLQSEPASLTAAIAARCAQRQGQFWPYHDLLYAKQAKLDVAALKGYAKEVGLEARSFDQCLDNRETAQEVERDLEEGRRVGLNGLPSLFINTIYVPGALPLEELNKLINGEIGRFGG